MPDYIIWSAPDEPYEDHIRLCLNSWATIKNRMLPTLSRLFEMEGNDVEKGIKFSIVCHDIGKLSMQWQDYIHKPREERKVGPPHATLGGAYLLVSNENNLTHLHNAAALAILMHHTDSGLAQGNLEHPAEDAINRGLIDYKTDNIRWAEGVEEAFGQSAIGLPYSDKLKPLSSVTLQSLEKMPLQLRLWSKTIPIEQHQRRLQTLAIHHILKVCDWRAAAQRPQADTDEDGDINDTKNKRDWQNSVLSIYLDGGLIP